MRGEYRDGLDSIMLSSELPPRARRIQVSLCHNALAVGTTSACAENTCSTFRKPIPLGNYLRVRGEYNRPWRGRASHQELPPRARRIPTPMCWVIAVTGTTSACAENTMCFIPLIQKEWNYLRVRGEYPHKMRSIAAVSELPPRARRIL